LRCCRGGRHQTRLVLARWYLYPMLSRTAYPRRNGFIEPCLPSPAPKPPTGPGWIHEIQHDGFRLIVRREGADVCLFTRRGIENPAAPTVKQEAEEDWGKEGC
jgi:ATP-dependent DNA ligase